MSYQAQPITLRPAVRLDEPLIRGMVRQARLNPFGLTWERFVLAITSDGQVVGCVQAKPHGDLLELASLVVLPGWRRKGIARLLICHLQEKVGSPLWLMCRGQLTPFYEAFSFRQVTDPAELPAYFRRIQRLSALFRPVIPADDRLAIMLWRG